MKLPRIYEYFVPGQLVTISEMKEKLERDGNTLRKRLSELLARGYIASVRQGLYVVCSAEQRFEHPFLSPFVVGSRLSAKSYIGFRSALQFHAGITPSAHESITVASPTKFNSFNYCQNHFLWCFCADDLNGVHWVPDILYAPNSIRVSKIERSVIDCLKRPLHCDDLNEFLGLCLMLKAPPDYSILLEYLRQSHISALCNRLGFLLDCMSVKWNVPESVMHLLQRQMSKKVSTWNVRVQRESASRTGASKALLPSYNDLNLLRARWKIHFPRHFEGRVRLAQIAQKDF